MKFKSIFSFFILSLIVIISAKILIPALKPSEKKTPAEFFLPQYGQVPNFNLIDASGKKVTGHDLNGIPWIADFIFTRCAFQCPLMTEKMKKISQTHLYVERGKGIDAALPSGLDGLSLVRCS